MAILVKPVEAPARRPVEQRTQIKLSEALRLGAMTTKQAFGQTITEDGGACAIGAIIIGMGGTVDRPGRVPGLLYDEGKRVGPLTCPSHRRRTSLFHPPNLCGERRPLISMLIHLNDGHRMRREDIGRWMESQGL
jgi:hypothetical protein